MGGISTIAKLIDPDGVGVQLRGGKWSVVSF